MTLFQYAVIAAGEVRPIHLDVENISQQAGVDDRERVMQIGRTAVLLVHGARDALVSRAAMVA